MNPEVYFPENFRDSRFPNLYWIDNPITKQYVMDSVKNQPYAVEIGMGYKPVFGPNIDANLPWFHFEYNRDEYADAKKFAPHMFRKMQRLDNLKVPLFMCLGIAPQDFITKASLLVYANIDHNSMKAPRYETLRSGQRLIALFDLPRATEPGSIIDIDFQYTIEFWLNLGYPSPIFTPRPSEPPWFYTDHNRVEEWVMDVTGK